MDSRFHVWEKVEIRLDAARSYANAYTDVTVWVDLEGPGFRRRCYGFWDGGGSFAVRVAATAPGAWKWRSGSEPADPGLAGKSGGFEAVEWTEAEKRANPCRRGFLRASANGRAFEHADGTACFLLGDTWWAAPTFRFPWRPGDTESTPRTFPHYVALRKRQGFNSVAILAALPNWVDDGAPALLQTGDGTILRAAWQQTDTGRAKAMHDEEGNTPFLFPGKIKGYEGSFPDLDRINPAYFRNLDRKIDYLNAHGFMPFVEAARRDIGQGWKRAHGWPDSYVRYIQYVWARLQANNCLLSPIHYDSGAQSITAPEWNLAANRVIDLYGPPPFGNPVGCNPHWTSLLDFGHTSEARWLTFHQSGNGQRHHYTYAQITDLFNTNPPVPVLNGEPQYEGMETLSHQPDPNWHWGEVRVPAAPSEENARAIRSAAYGSVLSGGLAGHIYGCGGWDGGVWRGDVEEASRVRVWEGMEWPGAAQMQHVRAFLLSEGDRYRDLVPSPQLLDPNRSGPVASYDGWSYCLASPERDLLLVYHENGTPATRLQGLACAGSYTATWFDPRTGKWDGKTMLKADSRGRVELPRKPDDSDWALKVAKAR